VCRYVEVENVFQNGKRIMVGAAKYYGSVSEGGFAACCNSLRLAKALDLRMWDDTKLPMKQIPQCGGLVQVECSRPIA
jgi:ATP-dependent DNA helicase HFM1/MER3